MKQSRIIRAAVAAYLRYQRQVPVVAFERGIGAGVPDIMAVTKDRFLLEVEVKVSLADFKRDAAKPKWRWRKLGMYGNREPAYFYFAVPKAMLEKVEPLLPEGTGLLYVDLDGGNNSITGLPNAWGQVSARRRPGAQRLRLGDVSDMVKHQTGTLVSLECETVAAELLRSRLQEIPA